ncbi:MAG TPA: hypothetical protein VHH52_01220, partial [Pseudonocardiaceae bacterium]|nr:hypothetical protein [Pseudonocardiaceae bacterium]
MVSFVSDDEAAAHLVWHQVLRARRVSAEMSPVVRRTKDALGLRRFTESCDKIGANKKCIDP